MKPTLIKGWDFPVSEYKEAREWGELLTAQIETSNLCDLICTYCFREDLGARSKKRLPGEISVDDTHMIIGEVIDYGAQTVNIIGAGEPTLDPALEEILEHISERGATPVVFTHGARITDKYIDLFERTGTSIIIKINSFDPSVQDTLAGRKGYTVKRNKGLNLLLEAGFNNPGEDHKTRLGMDSVICKSNYEEIPSIFNYCRENNIMPLMKTFIPAGRTEGRTDMEISREDYFALARQIQQTDAERDINYSGLFPYLGGTPCTQNGPTSIYVTILGDIYECPGQNKPYGNIRDIPAHVAFEELREREQPGTHRCDPRTKYWKSIEDIK